MKRICNLAAAALMAALCTASTASALPLTWRADWPDAKPVETLVHRGTDIELRPLWRINKELADTNGWTFTTYCQTNAVGPWFGPLPGAFFSHTNDVGAAFYNVIVRAETPSGEVNYTAFARLRMLDSPGFAPGVLPLPTKSIDFADVTVFNAPYYTKAETDERIVALSPAPGDYAAVSNAAMTAATKTEPIIVEDGDWFFEGVAMYANNARQAIRLADDSGLHDLEFDEVSSRWRSNEYYGLELKYFAYLSDLSAAATAATNYTDEAIASIAIPEPDLSDYTTHDDATNAARAVSAPLEENVGVLWQYVLGDTVWFAVTNYMRTVEGVVPSLQLWEVRDGATNLVYHSTEEITNFVNAATAALRADLTNSLAARAWSKYQSATGAENPQPGDITIVSTPSIMMTGGGEWNRYVHTGGSSVWVLRSSGLTTFGGGSNGSFFAVQDDEGNTQFEVRRTDSYEVDALPSATGFDGDDFQVTYNLPASGNPPTLYASTNLATTAFAAEENGSIDSLGITVNWASSGGLWRATIVQDVKAPALFVHAKALQEGSIVVKNNAPTSLAGGIFIGNTKYSIGTATISGHTVLTLTPAP